MLRIFLVLSFFLVNAELDATGKKAFKKIHSWYNPKIKWSRQLEEKALEYLNRKKIWRRTSWTYRKDKSLPVGVKVLDTFDGPKWNETEKLTDLPEGTRYGCNIIYQEGSTEDVLGYACLYKKI
uniref:SCP domain-containing protein n=2 Tax=Haemonchus contortus TaxID=6289 RepID=A0A6F7PQZ7_HAECO